MTPHLHAKLLIVSGLVAIALGACGEDEGSKTQQPLVDSGGPAGSCGDGTVNSAAGEQCDGLNLLGGTCASATMSAMPSGALACNPTTCKYDTSACRPASGGSGGSTPVGSGGSTPQPQGGSPALGGSPGTGGGP